MSSSRPAKSNTQGNGLLRTLGALLALASAILAILGVVFQQSVLSLIFSGFIMLFAVRVFVLWLGSNRATASRLMPHQQQMFSTGQGTQYPVAQYAQESRPMTPTGSLVPPQPGYPATNMGSVPATPAYRTNPVSDGGIVYASANSQPSNAPLSPFPMAVSGFEYAAPPAYAFQSAYMPGAAAHERGSSQTYISGPYAAIEQDALFALDPPVGNVRCFMLAKEGKSLVECQDRYAISAAKSCYAVADGVAGSLVPGSWARIVAKGFVERGGKFANKEDFQHWLMECSREWQWWIESRWIPTINTLREQNGERQGDWGNDLRQGAQTTLIGCSLVSNAEFREAPTSATIFAVGDSEFFLFSPNPSGGYDIAETFPFSELDEFSVLPDTLVTVPRTDLLERAWVQRKTLNINVFSGDVIVLATDALAKWLLTQVYQNTNKWLPLLSSSAVEFERHMRSELQQGLLENDDVTMMVIPIQ